jgi:hypothetical protein
MGGLHDFMIETISTIANIAIAGIISTIIGGLYLQAYPAFGKKIRKKTGAVLRSITNSMPIGMLLTFKYILIASAIIGSLTYFLTTHTARVPILFMHSSSDSNGKSKESIKIFENDPVKLCSRSKAYIFVAQRDGNQATGTVYIEEVVGSESFSLAEGEERELYEGCGIGILDVRRFGDIEILVQVWSEAG